MTVKN
jgi:hypothetical protein